MRNFIFIIVSILAVGSAYPQNGKAIKGKVYDAESKEALQYATITDEHNMIVFSDASGGFSIITSDSLLHISYTGYESTKRKAAGESLLAVALRVSTSNLEQVIVSANRTPQKRSEAPIAISIINKQTMDDTKASRLDQLLNKVSGVFMVNLGNEQHEMSIRQPMTTKSLFLYMEDGIPIRTTGVYNHNALLEMNGAVAKSIEIIKGPSSAFYGGEAVAGAVNVITQGPPSFTSGMLSVQVNNNGYRRVEGQLGTSLNKWGVIASGYYANRTGGPIEHSNFHKSAITLRADYKPNDRTTWSNTLTYVDYYSDMYGALDSIKFSQRNYSTPYSVTYRSVNAARVKSMFTQKWNRSGESSIVFVYRNNSVKQIPSYSLGTVSGNPLLLRGQKNDNSFNSYALLGQHTQRFNFLDSKLVAGASIDMSPQTYYSQFLWYKADPETKKFTSTSPAAKDSLLQNYGTNILNAAAYINFEVSPAKGLKLVAALRYDAFRYDFQNGLDTSKTTVAVSTVNHFNRVTPKAGLTYKYKNIGFYANYSKGYVPPQLTELYSSGSKVAPYLLPQSFANYELGGWLSVIKNKLYIDYSLYFLKGTNEIISVKQPDNTTINQNTGKTSHKGIEYGINYKPSAEWAFRLSATNAKHIFINNIVKGVDYSGKEISGAPHFTSNTEITYKPKYLKGLRLSGEWQHQSNYFMDDMNLYKYNGFDVFNLRVGYSAKSVELWVNALNILNQYYSTYAVKSGSAGAGSYSYNLGDPLEITVGVSYKFGHK